MECEKCGGPIWDNSQKAASGNWKGPLLKCKDESCGWKKWPPRGQQQGNGGGKPQLPKRPLGPLYNDCMRIAATVVKKHIGDKATAADVIAATATVFIQAAQTGAPLVEAAPTPSDNGP